MKNKEQEYIADLEAQVDNLSLENEKLKTESFVVYSVLQVLLPLKILLSHNL